jgi:hypothetical protein
MAQPAHATGSSRKIGHGYALALRTGPTTHVTLVYFNDCPRGYTQNLVKAMAEEYFASAGLSTVDIELGERYNERSVRVKSAELERIARHLADNVFASFDVDKGQVLHIDLRGCSAADVQTRGVPLIGNFHY